MLPSCQGPSDESPEAPTTSTVISSPDSTIEVNQSVAIDFAQTVASQLWSGSGFLHPIYHSPGQPMDDLIAQAKPQMWRMPFFDEASDPLYNRVNRLGVKTIQIIVSDCYGYPGSTNCHGSPVWHRPYERPLEWIEYVRSLATLVKNANLNPGLQIQFDVWSEPDLHWFWDGTWEQWLTTYLDAYRTIKSVIPDAVIGGPSVANSNWNHLLGELSVDYWNDTKSRLEQLMQFCDGQCEVDFISYHENNSDSPALIAEHLAEIHALVARYPAAGVDRVYINEYMGSLGHLAPGNIEASFHYLEKGRADGAVRACWHDSQDVSECGNDSLDGILGSDDQGLPAPRSAWWAYWAYGLLGTERYATNHTHQAIVPLASEYSDSAHSTDAKIVLLGFSHLAGLTEAQNVLLQLQGIVAQEVELVVQLIPYTGEALLAAPVLLYQDNVSISNGELKKIIVNFQPAELIVAIIRPKSG